MPQMLYTEDEYKTLRRETAALTSTVARFTDYMRHLQPEDTAHKVARPDGSYIYIPLDASAQINLLSLLFQALMPFSHAPRFLEVGSGLGVMAHMAATMGFRATGIEHTPALRDQARKLFPGPEFLLQDALTFDGYGEFDAIYYYCPLHDVSKQQQLEERIESQMAPGALLAPVLKQSRKFLESKQFVRLEPGDIYRKLEPKPVH